MTVKITTWSKVKVTYSKFAVKRCVVMDQTPVPLGSTLVFPVRHLFMFSVSFIIGAVVHSCVPRMPKMKRKEHRMNAPLRGLHLNGHSL